MNEIVLAGIREILIISAHLDLQTVLLFVVQFFKQFLSRQNFHF